jgi:hypothetical protein
VRFVFYNQTEFSSSKIIDILDSENVRYKLESNRVNPFCNVYIYNIAIDVTYEKFLFLQMLINKALAPYVTAMKSYDLPSYTPEHEIIKTKEVPINVTMTITNDTPIVLLDKIHKSIFTDYNVEVVTKKTKKSLLKRLIDYLTNNY